MTTDTIFDVASLTKVVATTTSVMMLLEQGRLRAGRTGRDLHPGVRKYGKQRITIRHLLTHVSGLRGDLDMALEFQGAEAAIRLAAEEVPVAAAGRSGSSTATSTSSCSGRSSTRVSGERLDAFARTHIFEPLGMRDTMFLPAASLRPRIAPTESCAPLAWPCGGPPTADAARCRARPDRETHGRRGRPCRPVQHRRRPRALLPHAARGRHARRSARALAARPWR